MKVNKGKIIVTLILFTMLAQVCLPIFQNISLAADNKIMQEWDISSNNTGSVMAKLDNTGTLSISGTGNMKNWNHEAEIYAPWYEIRSSITKVNIVEGVKNIGYYAFYNCDQLTSVTIQKGVTTIGKNAFRECKALASIEISEGVTSIGGYAFSGCTSLKDVKIPNGVMSIGSYAFLDCSALINIEIPEGLTSLGEGAFSECTSLKELEIPKGLSKIGSLTFNNCTSLSSIIIPEEIKEIGHQAFQGCSSLEKVIIPNGVTNIHNQAFANCESINIISKNNSAAEACAKAENIQYTIDEQKPQIEFTIDEAKNSEQKASITVQVTDNIAGLDENSLKYTWSTKNTAVEFDEISTSFKNGDSIESGALTGKYYLWVTACDLVGNYIIQSTTVCNLDNTLPTITVSVVTNRAEIMITVAEMGSGLSSTNSYQYYVSTSASMPVGGEWKNYVSGTPIKIEKGRIETYYLFIKQINDKAGNASSSNGTNVTIDGVTYHRFGPYTREIEAVIFTPNGNEKWEQSATVKVEGLGENLQENYSYAWVEEAKSLNVGDSAIELNYIEFDSNEPSNVIVNSNGSENGKYNLVIIEKASNKIIAKTNTFELTTDTLAPTLKVTYSTTEMTNKNVKVTITASEEIQKIDGWQLTEDKRQLIKEYEANTLETILVEDIVGNQTEQEINIENIDKNVPVLNIEYSATEMTNKNVIVTISADKEVQELEGWKRTEDKKQLTKEYAENINETVIVKDLMENRAEQSIRIKNIDKTPATLEVKYSETESTNGDVKVIIIAREELQPLDGWELSGDKKQLIKEYTENTEETIVVKDLANNKTEQPISIKNIDKTPAVLDVTYSTKEKTKQSITVTIKSNEKLQLLDGWKLSEDRLQLTKEYRINTEEDGQKIIVKDLVGNETEQIITIENIDKKAPFLKIVYSSGEKTNKNVTVIIIADEEIQPVEGWKLSENKMQLTKIYEENTSNFEDGAEIVTIKDLLGNETKQNIIIANIDKTPAVLEAEYSSKEETKENVRVTIKANEEMQPVEGWKLSENKRELSKTYIQNQNETVTVKDLAGNISNIEIFVENIQASVQKGDMDGDGKIKLSDMSIINRTRLRKKELSEEDALAADVTGDGVIDFKDLVKINRYRLNKIDEL